MLQDINLRELAEMQSNGRDFVSVYFSGPGGLNALKSRERNLRDMLKDELDEAEHFEATMKQIKSLLEENPTDAEGVCVFACAVLDFVRGYPLEMPVPNLLRVGPSPYIRPLAELQDEYTTFAVVACDNHAARLYLVTNETAELEDRIKGDIKNHVRKGGWSQKRYSRRRDNQLNHYAKEIAQTLADIVRTEALQRVLLIGSSETMQEIEDQLSPDVAEKVLAKEAFDLHRGTDEIVERAYEMYFDEERDEEQRLWESIKNEYRGGDLAAFGPKEVLEALKVGRAEAVIVTRDAKIKGIRCRDCEQSAAGEMEQCPSCQSTSVFSVDLVEVLTENAELTSARTEYSDEIAGLTEVGHVAALLRY